MPDTFAEQIPVFDWSKGLDLLENAIDEENGIIRGVSIATANVEAIGHGEYSEDGELLREFWTDEQTLEDMLAACLAIGQPLKAKLEHGTGLSEIVGEFDNFRIDGEHLRADFQAYESSPHRAHLFNLAKRLSKQFGISVTAELGKVKRGAVDFMRCISVHSADFVEKPAINAALFNQKNRIDKPSKVSKNTLQMDEAKIKEMMESVMAPFTERLSALEGKMPKEEAMQAAETAKEEMSQKLTASESKISELESKLETQATELASLKQTAEDAKALGVKFGAELQSHEAPKNKDGKTFSGEMARLKSEGKNHYQALEVLRVSDFELCQKEATRLGLPSINNL